MILVVILTINVMQQLNIIVNLKNILHMTPNQQKLFVLKLKQRLKQNK
jgi:hypothetical protein